MRAILLLVFLMLLNQAAIAQTVTTAQTIATVEVYENGSALWTAENHQPLTTQSEVSEWESKYILNEQSISRSIQASALWNDINRSVLLAQNNSGRPMSIRDFNVSYDIVKTAPRTFGIIRYGFEWENFSRTNSSEIVIGDAFPEGIGIVLPTQLDKLIIKIPAGYDVLNASPSFDKLDGDRLIWDRILYNSFGKGEPYLVLSRKIIQEDTYLPYQSAYQSTWLLILVPIAILISGTLIVFWKRRRVNGRNDDSLIDDTADSTVYVDNTETNIDDDALMPLPDMTTEILGYEEMIERYLTRCGGQAYQSDIVKESGLSKSKISIILAKMKEDGRILKIRKGKENIIRMVAKDKDQ
ncbi:MAG: hypothetical protein M5U10_06550 [Candidatus Methanoperedens sp.]|nr:hypothetical protein [Candidatus Methanoperedens nitroreducens]MDJ1421557.1 hypothetical protein [Candidatus Methanoperedens sp.]